MSSLITDNSQRYGAWVVDVEDSPRYIVVDDALPGFEVDAANDLMEVLRDCASNNGRVVSIGWFLQCEEQRRVVKHMPYMMRVPTKARKRRRMDEVDEGEADEGEVDEGEV